MSWLQLAFTLLNIDAPATINGLADHILRVSSRIAIADLELVLATEHELFVDIHAELVPFFTSTATYRKRQQQFRCAVVARYERCVVSNYHADECEAAHIVPFCECLSFDTDNGILLNRVLHHLFDKHAFSINPLTTKVEVAPWANTYKSLQGFNGSKIACLLSPATLTYLSTHYARFAKKNISL